MRQQGRTSPRTPYTTEYRNRKGFSQTIETLEERVTGVELRSPQPSPVLGEQAVEVRLDGVLIGTHNILDFITGANVVLTLSDDGQTIRIEIESTGGGGGAPSGPAGGELGGTYPNPTVDATHSGSAHHVENHDHDGAPTQQLLAANTHGTPSPDTHHVAFVQGDADALYDPLGAAAAVAAAAVLDGDTANGELNGTYPNPAVDATHSGSSHAGTQAAAEATAAAALSGHVSSSNHTALRTRLIQPWIDPTAPDTAVAKFITGPMPFAGTFVEVTIKCKPGETCGATAQLVDVHKQLAADENTDTSTTIWSTQSNRPTITNTNKAGSTTTFNTAGFAKGDYLYIFSDQLGTGLTELLVGIECTVD